MVNFEDRVGQSLWNIVLNYLLVYKKCIINKKPRTYINLGVVIIPIVFILFLIFLLTNNYHFNVPFDNITYVSGQDSLILMTVNKNDLLGIEERERIEIHYANKIEKAKKLLLKDELKKLS